ncbi:MAG: hypothetical protein DRN81_02255 [Thermoproteota archaeon]|nr:MAG: hypothetical protein DRN81_02255 [Candidatus Korarchaeota archaeon]
MRHKCRIAPVLLGLLLPLVLFCCQEVLILQETDNSFESPVEQAITLKPTDIAKPSADDETYSVDVTVSNFWPRGGTWDDMFDPQRSWTGTNYGWCFNLDVDDTGGMHNVFLFALDQEGYDAMGTPGSIAIPPEEHVLMKATLVSGHYEFGWVFDSATTETVRFIISNADTAPWETVHVTGSVTWDRTGPDISLEPQSLQIGEIASGMELICATSTDNCFSVTRMWITIETQVDEEFHGEIAYSWDTTTREDGPIAVWIQAEDAAGNWASFGLGYVVVDNFAPNITPAADMVIPEGNTTETLWWEVHDTTPSYYEIWLDSEILETDVWNESTSWLSVTNDTLNTLSEGLWTFTLKAFDQVGHTTSDSVNVIAYTAPLIDSPLDFSILEATESNITWTPFDLYPDSFVGLRNGTTISNGTWSGNPITLYVDDTLVPGVYNYTLTVYDEVGSKATDTVYITILMDSDLDGISNIDEIGIYGTDPFNNDTDFDLMPDLWEIQYGLVPTANDSLGDLDSDNLSNVDEFFEGTDPTDDDCDSDLLPDGDEVHLYSTDPLDWDSDDDAMDDGWEIANDLNPLLNDAADDADGDLLSNIIEYTIGTFANNNDSDFDLMPDGWEYLNDLNPLLNDSADDFDMDGLLNLHEFQLGTLPNTNDTDLDSLPDAWEVANDLNPCVDDASGDLDLDTLSNLLEYLLGTAANSNDSDFDLMLDGYEYENGLNPLVDDSAGDLDMDTLLNIEEFYLGTAANNSDSDSDLMLDPYEVDNDLNPLVDDSGGDLDMDTLNNLLEFTLGSLANNNDSDSDMMPDQWEYQWGFNLTHDDSGDDFDSDFLTNLDEYLNGCNPHSTDSDLDTIIDGLEVNDYGTSPTSSDSDYDTMPDPWEIQYNLNPLADDTLEDPDEDLLSNIQEFEYKTNPRNRDSDADSLTDADEVLIYHTNPNQEDSDFDGMDDAWELQYGLNPLQDDAMGDPDYDGINNLREYDLGSNPRINAYSGIFLSLGVAAIGAVGVSFSVPILRRQRRNREEREKLRLAISRVVIKAGKRGENLLLSELVSAVKADGYKVDEIQVEREIKHMVDDGRIPGLSRPDDGTKVVICRQLT